MLPLPVTGGSILQYKDISVDAFIVLAKTRRVVLFGAGSMFYEALEGLSTHGMPIDNVRFVMDNGCAGRNIVASGKTWQIRSVEDSVRDIAPDDMILITPYEPFAEMAEQLETYGLQNICCLYPLFDVHAMMEQGTRELYPTRRSDHLMIPKVIHYFWFGPKDIPDWQKRCIESWHRYCPDYEFRLWNEQSYDIHKCKYMEDAYASGRMGFVPDYARLDVLYEQGGIYLDTDVELVRPLDELLYQPAFCGAQVGGTVNLGSGFGCVPGLEVIRAMRDEYFTAEFRRADGTYDLMSSPGYQTRTLERYGFQRNNRYQVIEDMAVYPADVLCGSVDMTGGREKTQNTYALHLPSLSWAGQRRITQAQKTRQMVQRMCMERQSK